MVKLQLPNPVRSSKRATPFTKSWPGYRRNSAAHERMILQCYEDVQQHATQSFEAAKRVSVGGFCVLIMTLLYTRVSDALAHFKIWGLETNSAT
jgi:hypothetical protein